MALLVPASAKTLVKTFSLKTGIVYVIKIPGFSFGRACGK